MKNKLTAPTHEEIVAILRAEAKRRGITVTELGVQAVQDTALVTKLAQGRDITLGKLHRVIAYLQGAA